MVSVSLAIADAPAEAVEEADEDSEDTEEEGACEDADEETPDDEQPASPAIASAPVKPMKFLLDTALCSMMVPSVIKLSVILHRNT